jgi:protein-S-isoprenylcysteine O-methyltransferase Ste14
LASSPIPILGHVIFLWPGLALLVVLAIAIIIWGRKSLQASSTDISPFRPTTSIVTSGPFWFSRKPLYVALTLLYLRLVLIFNTW